MAFFFSEGQNLKSKMAMTMLQIFLELIGESDRSVPRRADSFDSIILVTISHLQSLTLVLAFWVVAYGKQ